MTRRLMASAAVVFAMTVLLAAQGGGRPASPAGSSATQVGAKWIDITYGRPIKRGRDLWGSGADYGKTRAGPGRPSGAPAQT